MKTQRISILPLDEIIVPILDHIGNALQRTFVYPCHILPCEDISPHASALLHEGKYNSTALLLYILKKIPVGSLKILAVTHRDLYSPIFSYLYGEAQLKGTAALMSLYRLRPEFYHSPAERDLFLSRCEKQAIHEIGHTFGLVHCKDKNCVMYPSSNLGDTDVKSNSLCPLCTRLVRT
ncbi:MAG: archaemetzincin [Candidatus Aminicenantes bacterium]|jgi:archaemetzincin